MKSFRCNKLLLTLGLILPVLMLAALCGPAGPPEHRTFDVSFTDGKLEPDTLEVKQGDSVVLRVESDRPGSIHLHGYDIEQEVAAGAMGEFEFIADATGRFLLNFHSAGAPPDRRKSSMPSAMAVDKSLGEAMTEMAKTMGEMDHGPMAHGPVESAAPVEVGIAAQVDDNGGVHVSINTEGWRWAPEEVNLEPSTGAGHAHIYANGEKLTRVYGPYYYLDGLEPGTYEIMVNLNDNAHNTLTYNGQSLEDSLTLAVPPAEAGSGDREPAAAAAPMSLEVAAHPDPLGGYNLQVIPDGFAFSAGMGQAHAPGQGYGVLSVNGEEFSRLYVPWLQVPAQGEGTHTFTVALLNNEGNPYHYNGQPVAASVQVQEAADAGAGAGHHGGGAGIVELQLGYLVVLPR